MCQKMAGVACFGVFGGVPFAFTHTLAVAESRGREDKKLDVLNQELREDVLTGRGDARSVVPQAELPRFEINQFLFNHLSRCFSFQHKHIKFCSLNCQTGSTSKVNQLQKQSNQLLFNIQAKPKP